MKRMMLAVALVAGLALTGCVADNSYIDTETGMQEMKSKADSKVDKPWVGGDQGRLYNDKGL